MNVSPVSHQCTIEAIRQALCGIVMMPRSEAELHGIIERRLLAVGISHQREAPTATGPVDFALGSLAMEVKVAGSANDIARQIIRYLQEPQFTALVLVTARAITLPISHVETLEGDKPVHVIELWKNFA